MVDRKRNALGRFEKADKPTTAPPLFGQQGVIPSIQQYVGIYSAGNKFFKNPDEAYQANRHNAVRMWYDPVIQEPLQNRILATAQLQGFVEAEDKTDKTQVERANQVNKIIESIPGLLKLKIALLDGIWFGKAGAQLNYQWKKEKDGTKTLTVVDWTPVHGDSIYWKYDTGRVGILCTPKEGEGTKNLTTEPTDLGLAHVLDDREREAFIIHTHLHRQEDYFRLLKSGSAKGIGLRDMLYWAWYYKQEMFGLWTEFMERMGMGMTIYRYEASNPQSLAAVQALAQSQTSNSQIFFPYTQDKTLGGAGIERIEPNPAGAQAFMDSINEFNEQIKRLIVGQTLTSESGATGLGSGLAEVQENTFFRIVAMDATNLQETLTEQLVRIIHRHSFPEDDFKLSYKIPVDKPDPMKYLEAAEKFWGMGGALDEDEVREVLGFRKPTADSVVLRKGGTDLLGADPNADLLPTLKA